MPSGPKNQKFMNRHAVEANERKGVQAAKVKSAKEKAEEDKIWEETDKKVLKKAKKMCDEEQRQEEKEKQKKEKERLRAEEEAQISGGGCPKKVTTKALQREVAQMSSNYDTEMSKLRPRTIDIIGDNIVPQAQINSNAKYGEGSLPPVNNRDQVTGESATAPYTCEDNKIGKRAKVLFKKFCLDNEDNVKAENPGMRRTQYNDILWEMWQKSPSNPFVQRSEARAADAVSRERNWMFEDSDGSDNVES
eukprot:Tbor_TRINITY_DN5500_c3_g1::TRINITY_DN5500_c3_g1_i1::g.12833::m.12833